MYTMEVLRTQLGRRFGKTASQPRQTEKYAACGDRSLRGNPKQSHSRASHNSYPSFGVGVGPCDGLGGTEETEIGKEGHRMCAAAASKEKEGSFPQAGGGH